jgi:hypothetical protein
MFGYKPTIWMPKVRAAHRVYDGVMLTRSAARLKGHIQGAPLLCQ